MQQPLLPMLARPTAAGLRSEILAALGAAGLLDRSSIRSLVRTLALLVVLGGILFASWTTGSVMSLAALTIVQALVLAGFGFIGHDAMHRSLCAHRGLNDLLGRVGSGLVLGVGYGEWRSEHLEHHRLSQMEGCDPDMDAPPFVSLTTRAHARKPAWLQRLCRYQQYYLWLLSLALILKLRFVSQRRACRSPRRYGLDLLVLAGHWGLWFVLPLVTFDAGLGRVLLVYLGGTALLGAHFAAVFWVNHIGMPTVEAENRPAYLEHQAGAARNIRCHPLFDWLFGGLNFHIEHHLVPACPSGRLRAAQGIVRPMLEAHHVPYVEVSWPQAVAAIRRHLAQVAEVPRPRGCVD